MIQFHLNVIFRVKCYCSESYENINCANSNIFNLSILSFDDVQFLNTETLDLDSNAIVSIDWDFFARFSKLSWINLAHQVNFNCSNFIIPNMTFEVVHDCDIDTVTYSSVSKQNPTTTLKKNIFSTMKLRTKKPSFSMQKRTTIKKTVPTSQLIRTLFTVSTTPRKRFTVTLPNRKRPPIMIKKQLTTVSITTDELTTEYMTTIPTELDPFNELTIILISSVCILIIGMILF